MRRRNSRAWGVLYKISAEGLKTLTRIKGTHYEPKRIRVRNLAGQKLLVTTFLVKRISRQKRLWTNAAYVRHIVKGLRDHEVPEEYILHVIDDVAVRTNRRASQAADEEIRRIELLRTLRP